MSAQQRFESSDTSERCDGAEVKLGRLLIRGHPLFPLLSLVFEKCELATNADSADQARSRADFTMDIAQFAAELEHSRATPFTGIEEVDSVLIQAIQVLRFHLLEMEKVRELCESFCTRYISSLRGKMTATDLASADDAESPRTTPYQADPMDHSIGIPEPHFTITPDASSVIVARQVPLPTQLHFAYSCVDSRSDRTELLDADDPLEDFNPRLDDAMVVRDRAAVSRGGSRIQKPGRRRGIFPKCATNVLRAWLFRHLEHPYPLEDQKRQLSADTGLTVLQVNNWFINARRRIVQPMLDQSASSSSVPKLFSPDVAAYAAAIISHHQQHQSAYEAACVFASQSYVAQPAVGGSPAFMPHHQQMMKSASSPAYH